MVNAHVLQGVRGLCCGNGILVWPQKLKSNIDVVLAASPRNVLLTYLNEVVICVVVHVSGEFLCVDATHLAESDFLRG